MSEINIQEILNNLYIYVVWSIDEYLPKIFWALLILGIWLIVSLIIHKFIMYLFKKFNIIELIDKLNISISDKEKDKKKSKVKESEVVIIKKKISDKIKINEITSKAISYYVFLVFFRLSIIFIGIKEIEDFLSELINYLPSLFVAVVIWYFWVRFANFIYDVVYHTLDLSKQKTAKIIASWAKAIILFFTIMVVLDKIWMASEITNIILVWFISMLSIAWGLAFWLWWKDIAHEILESFRK